MKYSLKARLATLLLALFAAAGVLAEPLEKAEVEAALDAAYAKYKSLQEGANADYIPALAKVDSNIYGIALVTPDGTIYTKGDVESEVSIQSISKVFTMALVMDEQGPGAIYNNMGVDATGQGEAEQGNEEGAAHRRDSGEVGGHASSIESNACRGGAWKADPHRATRPVMPQSGPSPGDSSPTLRP